MRALLPLAALGLLAAPAIAKTKPPVFVESQPVKDKPVVALDPTKAYVLLRSDLATPLYLMKVPTAADQAAYDKLRADALAESREKYARKLVGYEQDRKLAAKTPNMRPPERPTEPTEDNFQFVSFEMMASVGVGPLNRFAKSKESSVYLQELTPGTYRIYGLLSVMPNGAAVGSCFCMGSVKFTARAGEIADMGVIQAKVTPQRYEGDSSHPADLAGQTFFAPAPAGMPNDPRLASARIVPARYHPIGKLPNYLGLTITRLPAMADVMRYDRDRIVDMSTPD